MAYFSDSQTSSVVPEISLDGWLSKMFQAYSTAIKARISKFSLQRWMNSGTVFRGEYWMQNTLEHPKDVDESTLWQVLERSAPLRYFLSPEELRSLLGRASAREKPLPSDMELAYKHQISTLSNLLASDESTQRVRKLKDLETTAKPIPLTPEVRRTLSVRRMTPSECERLQGFPAGWTELDTEP